MAKEIIEKLALTHISSFFEEFREKIDFKKFEEKDDLYLDGLKKEEKNILKAVIKYKTGELPGSDGEIKKK